MGGHLSHVQGFDKKYLMLLRKIFTNRPSFKCSKKPYSITLSLSDRIDTLIGFFGINEKHQAQKILMLKRIAMVLSEYLLRTKKILRLMI